MSDELRAILESAGMPVAESKERPKWCPGARIVQIDGRERRMPCDRDIAGDTGRCGPCGALERQNREELRERIEAAKEPGRAPPRRTGFSR